MFEVGQRVRTRGGWEATVLTVNNDGRLAVRHRGGVGMLHEADGCRFSNILSDFDLLPGAIDATGGEAHYQCGTCESDWGDDLLGATRCCANILKQHSPPETETDTKWDRDVRAALGNPEICTGKAAEHNLAEWFPGRIGITRFEIAAKQASLYADALAAIRAERGRV